MTHEVRRLAIEPFFTTKRVGEGTGLGLSQTYGFVKQSDGAMRVESEPGRGTQVELFLPRASECVVQKEEFGVLETAASRAHQGKLLLVEDEPEVLQIAACILEELGYQVIPADNGPAALAALETHPDVELVLTDISMPGPMNGVLFADLAVRRNPGLPVIFVSGFSDLSLLPPGARFIQKPYRLTTLVHQLNACLEPRQTQREPLPGAA